uniref:Uncharacterized protein n=1 Tax=Arundo donax TaxID=35708 RepID=A0A0A9B4G1_ARUDO
MTCNCKLMNTYILVSDFTLS